MTTPLRTPLYDDHIAAGGRMVEFAGYDMPVQYTSIIAESKVVRQGAGMFDVSHMARLHFRGERVLEFLEWITTNDVAKLKDGRGQYSILPNATGGAVDDIIVYRSSEHHYRMVVNASNHQKDVAHIQAQNKFGVEIEDETDRTAMIAVQGPSAVEIVAGLSDQGESLKQLPFFGTAVAKIAGVECFIARSGYTGEDGFEVVCAAQEASALWKALVAAGVTPCGLGSRDVLRVEAGLPLYGHELGDDFSPLEAGLGWVISKTKPFLGSEFIAATRKAGPSRKIYGIRLNSKRVAQPGMEVKVDGNQVGIVSSGVYSPSLESGIAFAFFDGSFAQDGDCIVVLRGQDEIGRRVNKRFVKRD